MTDPEIEKLFDNLREQEEKLKRGILTETCGAIGVGRLGGDTVHRLTVTHKGDACTLGLFKLDSDKCEKVFPLPAKKEYTDTVFRFYFMESSRYEIRYVDFHGTQCIDSITLEGES